MVGEVERPEPAVMEIIWTDPPRPDSARRGRVASAGGATWGRGTVKSTISRRGGKYKGASGTIKGQFRRAEQREAGSL